MIPVKGYDGLYRDENSSAIINADKNKYDEYIKTKYNLSKEKERIANLENELKEIKSLLYELIKNK